MVRVTHDDKKLILEILSRSFAENKSVTYVINRGYSNAKGIRALMDYSFEIFSLFGEIWISNNRQACALVLFPHLKRMTSVFIWLNIKLIFYAIGISGVKRVLLRENKIKKIPPKKEMAYLWFVGVIPENQ